MRINWVDNHYKERLSFNKMIRELVSGCNTDAQVVAVLERNGIPCENLTNEYGYLNIHILRPRGYVRVYKPYKSNEIEVNSFDI